MMKVARNLLIGISCVVLNAAAAQPAPTRPNVVVILADDLGYGEMTCQGNPEVPTPNIDSIARDGIRFTSGYVTAPFCAPSRCGLMTGRYQERFGYDINPTGKHNLNPEAGLPLNETTLADRMKAAGYATAIVGKWHLGGTREYCPRKRGFDQFYGFLHEGHYYGPTTSPAVISFLRATELPAGAGNRHTVGSVTWSKHSPMAEPPYDDDNPVMRDDSVTEEKEFLTDAWAREAAAFISGHRDEPFFLYLAYNAPHSPMQALDGYVNRFAHIEDLHRRVFAAMVAHLDESVGRVLETLRQNQLEKRTLVFFLSDNGGPTQELTSSNKPLAGGKGTLYEGGIRVPFMVKWPGHLPAGQTYDHPVLSLDILPTVLAAVGAATPIAAACDGVNLLPYLTGVQQGPPHAALFWRYGKNCAIRRGDWKLLRQGTPLFRLFHLASDIGETKDVSAQQPDIAAAMRSELERWLAELPAPISLKASYGNIPLLVGDE
jgi:arylsulfatase A-like enzyme